MSYQDIMLDAFELRVFVQVGRAARFVAAARALGITPSAASKAVARLEARVASKLLVRTTRSVRLTDAGAALYERALPIVTALDDAERALTSHGAAPSGRLRLDLPLTLGQRQIVPLLAGFSARYPQLELDVRLDDRYADLIADGVDIALRVGTLADSRLVARRLAGSRVVTVASPAFVKQHGRPRSPADLEPARCLSFRSANSGRALPWHFARKGKPLRFMPERAHTFSSSEALVAAALAGLGVAQVLDFAAAHELARGDLVELLPAHACAGPPISLVHPAEHGALVKVRAVRDFLLEAFARGAPWQASRARSP